MTDRDITDKRDRFVAEYLVDLNATQAAIRSGYSAKTAYSQGQRLLKDVEVAAAITKAQAKRAERTEITQDRVLQELAKIGFSDIRKAVKWGSRLVERTADQILDAAEMLEEQPGGGALKRRRAGDDGSDAFYVTTVEMVDSDDLDDATVAAVSEVSQTKEGVKLKMHDKLGALTQIGRHLGMFTDKTEVDMKGSVTLNVSSDDANA
jgi:phage terminase small subunit